MLQAVQDEVGLWGKAPISSAAAAAYLQPQLLIIHTSSHHQYSLADSVTRIT